MCIPKYFLYGEQVRPAEKRFLHLEPISLRARQHGGRIAPHSHPDLHQLLLFTEGGGVFCTESSTEEFRSPALVHVPVGTVHEFTLEQDTDGWVLSLATDLVGLITTDYPELQPLFSHPRMVRVECASETKRLCVSFETLTDELEGDAPGRRAALASALVALLVQAVRLSVRSGNTNAPECNRDSALVAQFRGLVESEYRADVGIGTYARRLCVSQERLRAACVRIAGAPPLALVAARRILEAKRGLLYTSLSLAQIAAHCGFDDPAYFSRFFTQRVGESPTAFRARRRLAHPAEISQAS